MLCYVLFLFFPLYPLFPRIPLQIQLFIDMMLMFGTISYFDFGFDVCIRYSYAEKKEFESRFVVSSFFGYWNLEMVRKAEKKQQNITHHYEMPTREYTKSMHYHGCCSSLYNVIFSILDLFRFFLLLVKWLEWYVFTYTLCYVVFLRFNRYVLSTYYVCVCVFFSH